MFNWNLQKSVWVKNIFWGLQARRRSHIYLVFCCQWFFGHSYLDHLKTGHDVYQCLLTAAALSTHSLLLPWFKLSLVGDLKMIVHPKAFSVQCSDHRPSSCTAMFSLRLSHWAHTWICLLLHQVAKTLQCFTSLHHYIFSLVSSLGCVPSLWSKPPVMQICGNTTCNTSFTKTLELFICYVFIGRVQ